MTDPTKPAIGLSVGATMLSAVTPERSITRRPVITLFRHRSPEVGLPSENPRLDEPGLVITDFVDRVGDPVPVVAADGSVHPAEALLADALRALAYTATAGRPLPPATAITHPAHWRAAAVDALRRAVGRIPEWSANEPLLIPDAGAAATALQADPGLPSRGVVALCDFGGSGTSITLFGADQAIAPTVRHLDFSGDLVDQGLLAHVLAELSAGGTLDVTGTSAIGSLTRLRAECRAAKERLSTVTVTALPAELPGFRGDVRLTRAELDEMMRQALAGLVTAVQDTMARAGVRPGDVAAVASIGGAAAIPVITTTLSEHLRVPVITTPRPALTAAIGAALRAARGPADTSATALAPAPVLAAEPVAPGEPGPATGRALAWSEAADLPDLAPVARRAPVREALPPVSPRPELDFEPDPVPATETSLPWYRRPMPVVVGALLVIAIAGAGTAVALRVDSGAAPATPSPSITTTPQAAPVPVDAPTSAPVQNQAVQATGVPPRTVVQAPAPATQTEIVQAPPVTTEAPPPPPVTETQTTTVVTTTVSTPPPVTETVAPPSSQPPFIPTIPTIPPIPTIPGLPQFLLPPQTSR
ncbi:hypothetical protein BayCH28_02675 [Mycolicibacterium sp. CH28]|uniref:Hsp70 family protein n=1 Tax=Mycolicibacterium sp. CH28 TaxID=2512237 RepID=UPI0010812133|nr:Hsp70 family protein [Mycolicibacterium sp. CH28]TGD90757.1 hypothetical protein BayCH28_02675 [Mycolicibacterium sp. CH28]